MYNFYYEQPVPIDFGADRIKDLPTILEKYKFQKGLLISAPSMVRNGVAQKIMDASNGKIKAIFSNIQPNPTVQNTDDCVEALVEHKCDFAIALGGGSILDCAKVACFVATTSYTTEVYFTKQQPITHKGLPLIAVPTTSGTASEITNVSVLTDTKRGIKAPLASEFLYPIYALVDPMLTLSCPQQVTASSGLDVLAHSLEAFYGKKHQPYTDLAAEYAAKLVFENLLVAYHAPNNLEARINMSLASVTAGMAFNLTQTAAAHACSYPLTQNFGVPHGEACALTLATFWKLNSIGKESKRLEAFSRRLGFEDSIDLANRIDEMKKDMQMCLTIEEAGVKTEEDLKLLVANSFAPNMQNNPVDVTPELLENLYKSISSIHSNS
ncbi:iron-containing alcohol dehydrogenase family protein [Rummeliibacillus suwonensis]|uniref:iron-containing alcohol dehydrogenase family protein n=1 Tax=Rummeliibacillus suwonensis TaxID=1306154 RepID=UPI00289C439C|nr:iron-containing alcohol dehydrogenase family protein [Rummeliibacillus suwonensis]